MFFYFRSREKKLQQKLVRSNEEKERLLGQLHALESDTTRFKLNPHLFKNTLNSIQAYAFRTHQSLEKLGGVLDYLLYDSDNEFISVKDEIEFSKNFIELNKIKLSPLFDLKINFQIDETSPFYHTPVITPLLTAHFIENVFKHADFHSREAFIAIHAELNGDTFLFEVSNKISKTPMFSPKSGIGKPNLKNQLDTIYGASYFLEYHAENDIYRSILKINLLEFQNKMRRSG